MPSREAQTVRLSHPTNCLLSLSLHTAMDPVVVAVLLLLSCLASSSEVASGVPVRDTHGNPLLSREPYYVLPVDRGNGVHVGTVDGSCPRHLFLRPAPPAEPVLFFPNETHRTILLQELLLVMFAEPSSCPESTQWTVNDTTGVVTTGGESPSSSDSSYNYYGFFRIDNYDILGPDYYRYYRLYSCPTPLLERPCSTIGVTRVGGLQRYPFPLIVQFEKVPEVKSRKMPKEWLMRPTAQGRWH